MNRRRAIATLELAMALPIVLTLTVALVWLGYSVIGQAEMAAEARRLAWSERFGTWASRKFDFNEENIVQRDASTTVEVTPILKSENGPQSQSMVESATWGHRDVTFAPMPNFRLSGEMVLAAKTVGIQAEVEDLQSLVTQLQSLGSTALSETMQEIATGLLNPGDQLDGASESAQQRVEIDEQLERARLQGEIRELDEQIDQVGRELRSSEELSEELEWLLEKKRERLKLQLKLARDQLSRM